MMLPDILQDARALAAACEELAEFLEGKAALLNEPEALASQESAFLRVLPLMCAFASPDCIKAFAARLRAIVRRLDALPASADELARVMAAPADEFARFEALLFEAHQSRNSANDFPTLAKQGVLFGDEADCGIPQSASDEPGSSRNSGMKKGGAA